MSQDSISAVSRFQESSPLGCISSAMTGSTFSSRSFDATSARSFGWSRIELLMKIRRGPGTGPI